MSTAADAAWLRISRCCRLVKGEEEERLVSPVHSLAIQRDALWGLSGCEVRASQAVVAVANAAQSGNINLTSIRHDPGATRHVLRRHTAAVSVLTLCNDDATLVSGGWDRAVHVSSHLAWAWHDADRPRSNGTCTPARSCARSTATPGRSRRSRSALPAPRL